MNNLPEDSYILYKAGIKLSFELDPPTSHSVLTHPNNSPPQNRYPPCIQVQLGGGVALARPPSGYLFQPVPDACTNSSPAQPTHPAPSTLEVTQRLSDRRETDSCGFVLGRGRAVRWGSPRGNPQSCLLHTPPCGLAVMTEGRTSCCFPDDLQDRNPRSA